MSNDWKRGHVARVVQTSVYVFCHVYINLIKFWVIYSTVFFRYTICMEKRALAESSDRKLKISAVML